MPFKFSFPFNGDFLHFPTKPVAVVGLIGNSRAGTASLTTILNCTVSGANFSEDTDNSTVQVHILAIVNNNIAY